MFMATRAAESAKLRRSGMNEISDPIRDSLVPERTRIRAAPTELGRAFGLVVTINMALLTELACHRRHFVRALHSGWQPIMRLAAASNRFGRFQVLLLGRSGAGPAARSARAFSIAPGLVLEPPCCRGWHLSGHRPDSVA